MGGINHQLIWLVYGIALPTRFCPGHSDTGRPDETHACQLRGGLKLRAAMWFSRWNTTGQHSQVQKLMTIFIEESKVKPQAWGFFSLGTHGSDEGDKVWDTLESGVLIEIVMLRMVRWRVLRGFGECVWAAKMKKKQVEQDTKIFKYFVHVSAKPSRQNFNFNKFTSLPVVNLPLSQDSKLECIDPLPMCPCHRPVHPLLPQSDEVTGLQLGHSKYPCWLVIGGCTCPVCWGWS